MERKEGTSLKGVEETSTEEVVLGNIDRPIFEKEDILEVDEKYLQAFPSELLENHSKESQDIPTEFFWTPRTPTGDQGGGLSIRQVSLRVFPRTSQTRSVHSRGNLWELRENQLGPRKMDRTRDIECRKQIEILLSHGILQESKAAFYSHALLVPKPNNKWRFCMDFKRLNKATNKEGWSLPIIQLMLDRIGYVRLRYFIVLHLSSGYFHILIAEDSRKFTAFITPSGLYE